LKNIEISDVGMKKWRSKLHKMMGMFLEDLALPDSSI
jgi:hypothetical protein